jgi:hypothetical protein
VDVCSSNGIAFVIALAAISFQAIKAAAANPVESEKSHFTFPASIQILGKRSNA